MAFHLIYLSLKESKLGIFLTEIGRLFQILGPEYDKLFGKISKFGLGMYRVESDEDLKFTSFGWDFKPRSRLHDLVVSGTLN